MLWILTVFIAIFTVIVEIFTTVFMLTGLSHTKSKFQVISMLTSTGFTTKESEVIMLDPVRRRYAQILIVFGYCSSVTIVSMLVSSINRNTEWYQYIISSTLLILFILIINNKKLRKKIDPKIQNFGAKVLYGKNENFLVILETLNEKVVGKIKLNNLPEEFEGKTIEEMKINNVHKIQILAIERNKRILKHVTKDDYLKVGDLILVYGSQHNINCALNVKGCNTK